MSLLMNLFILGIATMFAVQSSWSLNFWTPPPIFSRNLPSKNYSLPTRLSMKLFLEVAKNQKAKNTVMSPLSVQIALSILYVGAAGKTRSKMAKALGITKNSREKYLHSLGSVVSFAKRDTFLKTASTVFFNKKMKLFINYKKSIKKLLLTDVKKLDFSNGSKSAKLVNKWCSKNTNGMIQKLVQESDFSNDTLAMIVNAIYFNAKWEKQFVEPMTETKDFSTVDESGSIVKVKVKMMKSFEKEFQYNDNHEELNAQIVSLQYNTSYAGPGDDFRMVIILPKEIDGFKNTLNKLKNLDLEAVLKTLDYQTVVVSLPKFKEEVTLDLKENLKKVGLRDIFSRNANFKKLTRHNVTVGKVVQKAVISVAENGTEAAAATVIKVMQVVSSHQILGRKPYSFVADHPFIYLIMLKGTAIPIFQGVVMKPEFKD